MVEFFRRHQKKLAGIVLVLLPLILIATSAGASVGVASRSAPSQWAKRGVGWFQLTGANVTGTLSEWLTGWRDDSLRKKIQRLEDEVARLREEKSQLIGVLQENSRLRELAEMRTHRPELTVVPASVIGRDISPYFRVLKIKIHSHARLEPRMPVVVPGGVVGQIHEVYGDYADVVLVSDPRSRIDALTQRNRAQGVVQGLGRKRDYYGRVAYLSQKDDVRTGDVMVTSGMGGIFPKELIIGTIERVHNAESGLFQEVWLSPAVDFSRIEEVFIITDYR